MNVCGYIIVGIICIFIGFTICALLSACKCSEYESVINELQTVIKCYRDNEKNKNNKQ